MKIAFFGTPQFAAEILTGILEYDDVLVDLVVSQADKPVGRKKELLPTAVKKVALDNNIEVLQPIKIKNNDKFIENLKERDLDFIVVVAYGKIIPTNILDIPKHGCINIHGSILPEYRGASPVQAAVKDGKTETWLTIMYMSEGMDEWDMLRHGKIKVDNVDTSINVFEKFVEIGPDLLIKTLKWVLSGEVSAKPQNEDEATYCGKISREDGQVSFTKQTGKEIYDTYRAYTPWPGIYSFYNEKRFVLEKIEFHHETAPWVSPWMIIKNGKRYGIVCWDNTILELKQVKLEGKKSMDITSFINGNKDVLEYVFT